MPYKIGPEDAHISRLLDQDRIGNLTIQGELEAADEGEIKVYTDDPENPYYRRGGWK